MGTPFQEQGLGALSTTVKGGLNNLIGSVAAGTFLRGNGVNAVMSPIQVSDVPTLNQNTTGSAGSLSNVLGFNYGGTGSTTQQAALNAIAGAVTSGLVLRGNGTNVTLAAIQASDIPTLNQNTTGSAATANALNNANNYSIAGVLNFYNGGTGGGNITGNNTTYGIYYRPSVAGSSYSHAFINAAGTAVAVGITDAGNLVATGNVTAYSDETLKTNWRDVPKNFVARLAKVKHGIYDRTDIKATQVGVSAQSLRRLLPQSVMKDKATGLFSVAYGNAALLSCVEIANDSVELRNIIKEQAKLIARMEKRILKLEAK